MSDQREQATDKLRTEINASTNPAVKAIGQFLLQHIEESPDDATCIVAADKTIAKSLDKMREVARKKAVNNVAVLTDEEGFAIVLDYFKTEAPPAKAPAAAEPAKPADKAATSRSRKNEPKPPAPDEEDDIDFDSLLE